MLSSHPIRTLFIDGEGASWTQYPNAFFSFFPEKCTADIRDLLYSILRNLLIHGKCWGKKIKTVEEDPLRLPWFVKCFVIMYTFVQCRHTQVSERKVWEAGSQFKKWNLSEQASNFCDTNFAKIESHSPTCLNEFHRLLVWMLFDTVHYHYAIHSFLLVSMVQTLFASRRFEQRSAKQKTHIHTREDRKKRTTSTKFGTTRCSCQILFSCEQKTNWGSIFKMKWKHAAMFSVRCAVRFLFLSSDNVCQLFSLVLYEICSLFVASFFSDAEIYVEIRFLKIPISTMANIAFTYSTHTHY